MSDEQEEELSNLILDMESRLYELSPIDIRTIVYQFCKKAT